MTGHEKVLIGPWPRPVEDMTDEDLDALADALFDVLQLDRAMLRPDLPEQDHRP